MTSNTRARVWLLGGVLTALMFCRAEASEESADWRTQVALGLDSHPVRGGVLFSHDCASCHGGQAQGNAARVVPALAGQRFDYLIRQVANFSTAQRDDGPMPHVLANERFTEPQMWNDVASYLSRLPPASIRNVGDAPKGALGRGIFHEQCASCHQADAGGDVAGFVPSLRNQHRQYLVSQLHRLAAGHRRNVEQSLVLFMRSFDENDIDAIADYLSLLQQERPRTHERMLSNGVVVD